jgi:PTH2 family peptidyl-tRNA hydrolase
MLEIVVEPNAEYVMYIAAIKLPPGKLAAQVSHAVLGLYRLNLAKERRVIDEWLLGDLRGDRGVEAKVVLKLENMEEIKAYCEEKCIPYYVVQDAGRTVVEPGTITAIAWGPVLKEENGPWKTMKLL